MWSGSLQTMRPTGAQSLPALRSPSELRHFDTRINPSVEDINNEIDQDSDQHVGQQHRLQQHVIALRNSAQDQSPEAWSGKDNLDSDRVADHDDRVKTDKRDDGNQRVAKHVLIKDPVLAQPFGA